MYKLGKGIPFTVASLFAGKFFFERLGDTGSHKLVNIATEAGDLAHDRRTQIHALRRAHNKNRLKFVIQTII